VGEVIDRAVALMAERTKSGAADAEPRIRIDDLTAGLLGERFEITGDVEGLFLASEREATYEPRRLLGKPMPCVGRARELGVLEATLGEVVDEGVARGVLLTAGAGLGKSRVVAELLRRVAVQQPDVEIWLGRGDAISSGAALGILSSALRRAGGIADGEALAVRRRKWAARVARNLSGADAIRATEFLGEIVGAPVGDDASVQLRAARNEPALMGDQLARAFEELLLGETSAHPLLIVLEDFQWGDAGTLRMIEAAMRACRERPLFVLVAGRSEALAQFPTLSTLRGFTQVTLAELSRRAAEQLVHEALGDAIDAPTRERLVVRAAGHPFYLEELIRCAASGTSTALPDTILAMLQTRLEGLAPEPRRLLRAASVFGTTFWSSGMARLLGSPTGTTVDARDWMPILLAEELVERRASSRFPEHDEYVFRNAMLREAAYAMLTDHDRAVGHRLAAAWLEAAGERDPMVLGEHWARAGELVPAARAFVRAAQQALEGHDVGAALAHARRAREVGGHEGPLGEAAGVEAEAQRWLGNFVEAEALATEAAAALPRGSTAWFRAIGELIGAAGRRGEYELAID
jgi:predicted ATPase